jgi:hypothetical protein
MSNIRLDLSEKRFGKVEVKSFAYIGPKGATHWNCHCDCGNDFIIRGSYLTGGTKSCGCLVSKIGTNHAGFRGCGELPLTYWGRIKEGAERRGTKFSISIDYAWDLFIKQNRECAITGLPLQLFSRANKKQNGDASLDRIDSSKGYIEGNVQWVHKDINMMKGKYNQPYFIEMCRKVVAYHQVKPGLNYGG